MTYDDWRNDLESCYMPLNRLLRVVHYYTEVVRIEVVIGDCRLKYPEFKRLTDFVLTKNAFSDINGEHEELTRILKYYGDAPAWNVVARFARLEGAINAVIPQIVVHVHFEDIAEAYKQEKEDIRKQKRRNRNV